MRLIQGRLLEHLSSEHLTWEEPEHIKQVDNLFQFGEKEKNSRSPLLI